MTWPTTAISTANLDSGGDNPSLARIQILAAVQDINSVAAEFGNVAVSNVANLQLLQYNGTASQWQNGFLALHRYTERLYNHTVTTGNVTVDYDNGNVQRIQATGNVNISFANFPPVGTATLIFDHNGANRTATFPATGRFQSATANLTVGTNTIDVVVITTYDAGSTFLISIARNFAAQ